MRTLTILGSLWAMLGLGDVSLPRPEPQPPGPRYLLARVERGAVALRAAPGGRLIARARAETEFASPRTFWVARRRGQWLGAPAPEAGNGELAWFRYRPDAIDLYETSYSLRADRARQRLEIRYGRRLVHAIRVTVGRPGSETPSGSYSVTDALAGSGIGPYYGCCVLALSGHQPSLPPGWIGGDRIAIHGTPGSVGGARSAGCLRASDYDMVSLFATVPLGTPVFIE